MWRGAAANRTELRLQQRRRFATEIRTARRRRETELRSCDAART